MCGNPARTDLCGGTPARAFPTATANYSVGVECGVLGTRELSVVSPEIGVDDRRPIRRVATSYWYQIARQKKGQRGANAPRR